MQERRKVGNEKNNLEDHEKALKTMESSNAPKSDEQLRNEGRFEVRVEEEREKVDADAEQLRKDEENLVKVKGKRAAATNKILKEELDDDERKIDALDEEIAEEAAIVATLRDEVKV